MEHSTTYLENGNFNRNFKAKLFPQVASTSVACIGAFVLGSVIGWSSPAIPDLDKSRDFGTLSDTDKSWLGSLTHAGAALAGLAVGPLMNRFGRKWTIFLFQFPGIAGWLLIIFANGLGMMYVGRILTGFCGGSMTLIIPIYVGETCEDKIRGTMSTMLSVFLTLGILFSYAVGAVVSWKVLSIILLAFPILALAIVFMPESPRHLLEKSKTQDARKALASLRGANNLADVEYEINIIQKSIEENNQNSASLSDLFVPSILKPVGISYLLMFLQQFCGINAVLAYTSDIFASAGSSIDPNVSTIIVGTVQFVFTIVAASLVDRLGRKPLLILSDFGMSICLIVLGVFFYLKANNNNETPDGIGWLPLVSLIVYMIMYNIGFNPLPWVMLSELTPNHIKGLAGGIGSSFCWGLAFIVTRTFPDLSAALTAQGCYWLFGGFSLAGTLFCFFVVPETKGKSLDEINALFR